MKKRYPVILSDTERDDLKRLIASGTTPARKLTHARILLKADESPKGEGWVDERIAEAVESSQPTVSRVRKQYCCESLEAALNRRPPKREYRRKLDGEQEARLCRFGLQRAARGPRSLELATFGRQTGGTRDRRGHLLPDGQEDSQKNTLKPHLKRQWSIPPQQNAEFVWRMEDVLEVYTRPYDPLRQVVCMDETSKQLLRDGRQPLPMEPGKAEREDYAYERGGVANVFMFMEPLAGRRWIDITERRTKVDWSRQIKELADVRYPQAEKIVLVMDNLNTHTPASLYEAFCPEEARRIAEKLEIHYTPKHGSWLNMAEIELSVLSRQCLERRVPNFETLQSEAHAWQQRRDGAGITINWRFTTDDARIKLKRLYPSFQE